VIFCIPNVLAPELLSEVRGGLEEAAFVDGRVTANEPAKLVKHNLQLDERDALHTKLSKAIAEAVLSNSLFQIAWPKTMLGFRFSRYDPGMGYGEHVDDPLFQGHRSDVSMTHLPFRSRGIRGRRTCDRAGRHGALSLDDVAPR
jgi:PKHD-type hydroxylase